MDGGGGREEKTPPPLLRPEAPGEEKAPRAPRAAAPWWGPTSDPCAGRGELQAHVVQLRFGGGADGDVHIGGRFAAWSLRRWGSCGE